MQLGSILTFGSYVTLAVLWTSILILYARRVGEARRRDTLVAGLLVVLIADAMKNVIETLYFGALWGARFGFLPVSWGVILENPMAIAMPKILNIGVAVFVLVRIVYGFVGKELDERRNREREARRLQEELERSLALVQESEGRLQSLLERTSDVVAFWRVVDRDLILESINQAGKSVLGFGDDAIGTSWRQVAPPALQALLNTALETGQAQREEDGWLDVDAGRLAVIRQVVPLPDEDGVIRRVASFTQDITALRERQADEEAHTRLESLGILASGVAHDFNNLLAILRADVDAAADHDSRRDVALGHAQITIDRARDLVSQLLAMAGKQVPVAGAVDVADVVTDTVRLIMPSVPNGITLSTQVSGSAVVVGDRIQLQQLVLNLVKNGIDAAAAHGGSSVKVALSASDDTVTMTVTDDGPGIEPAVQRRIFEPFFTTKRQGRGLGLATVFGVAKAHGGAVEVQSPPGKGATFVVSLPRATRVAAPAPSVPASSSPSASSTPSSPMSTSTSTSASPTSSSPVSSWSPPSPTPPEDPVVHASDTAAADENAAIAVPPRLLPAAPLGELLAPPPEHLHILLIDDDHLVRRSTRRLAERLGHTVVDVDSGPAALEVKAHYDVALVDVTMPDMDGPTTLLRLRQLRPELVAILVTGRGDLAGGDEAVLTKPFDEAALKEALVKVFGEQARRRRRHTP
jgi:signal transduction histidine kinase/CheY-like chemotaxis protein